MSKRTIIIGTRGSKLAITQTEWVRKTLLENHPDLDLAIRVIKTEGDIDRTSPLSSFGGQGAFVRAIETALMEGIIDAAVHSLKDLPSRLPDGLVLGAVPVREDPRDALVAANGLTFKNLPLGSAIGTGSDRRRIQAAAMRPDLEWRPIRGNIETRINSVGADGLDGVMLARAGIARLGLADRLTDVFDTEDILPAPCQGALGLECRESDAEVATILRGIEHAGSRICADVERAFISTLGFGCHAPVAALAVLSGVTVTFTAFAAGDSGKTVRRTLETCAGSAADAARGLADDMKRDLE